VETLSILNEDSIPTNQEKILNKFSVAQERAPFAMRLAMTNLKQAVETDSLLNREIVFTMSLTLVEINERLLAIEEDNRKILSLFKDKADGMLQQPKQNLQYP
jgi:hypothetical protein